MSVGVGGREVKEIEWGGDQEDLVLFLRAQRQSSGLAMKDGVSVLIGTVGLMGLASALFCTQFVSL